MSRYRPTTQPHDSVENPSMRTTLIDLSPSLPTFSKYRAGQLEDTSAGEAGISDRLALSERGSSYTAGCGSAPTPASIAINQVGSNFTALNRRASQVRHAPSC